MAWLGRGSPPPGIRERRQSTRADAHHMATLYVQGTRVPVTLENISRDGTRLRLRAVHPDVDFAKANILEIPGLARVPVKLRWHQQTGLGAEFDLPGPRRAMLQGQIRKMLERSTRR